MLAGGKHTMKIGAPKGRMRGNSAAGGKKKQNTVMWHYKEQPSSVICSFLTNATFPWGKAFPQGLWIMNRLHCGKVGQKIWGKPAVEKWNFHTDALWKKRPWGSKAKGSFPHKKSLLKLLLKFILIIYYYLLFRQKGRSLCVLPVKKTCWFRA